MSIASTLKPELATKLKTLFEKLDTTLAGSITLDALKKNWNDQNDLRDVPETSHVELSSVLKSVERFAVNGNLSFERLCCGIKLSLIDDGAALSTSTADATHEALTPVPETSDKLAHERQKDHSKSESKSTGSTDSKDLFAVASKYNIKFTPRTNSTEYASSGYSTGNKSETRSNLTSTPFDTQKTDATRKTPDFKQDDDWMDFKHLNLESLDTSKVSQEDTQDQVVSFEKSSKKISVDFSKDETKKEETENEISTYSRMGVHGYQMAEFDNTQRSREGNQERKTYSDSRKTLNTLSDENKEVSMYSVTDKSLISQSMIEMFGYHPPRSFSPIQVQISPYQLPSTLNYASKNLVEHDVCKKDSDEPIQQLNGYKDQQVNRGKLLSDETRRENIDPFSRFDGEPSEEFSHRKTGSPLQIRQDDSAKSYSSPEKLSDSKEFNQSENVRRWDTRTESRFESGPSFERTRHDFPKSGDNKVNERPSSSSSTYSIISTRSPIPPIGKGAYYELDDETNSCERFQSPKNVSKCLTSTVIQGKAKSELDKSFGSDRDPNSLPSRRNLDSQGYSKISWGSSSVDREETFKLKSPSKEIGRVDSPNCPGFSKKTNFSSREMAKHDEYTSRWKNSSSDNESNSLKHQFPNERPKSESVVESSDKMDRMLDQALRAVNESYRLIRIGKKQLRTNSFRDSNSSGDNSCRQQQKNGGTLPGGNEKYLRLMNSVLELHKSLLDLIDTSNEVPADLADGECLHGGSADLSSGNISRVSFK